MQRRSTTSQSSFVCISLSVDFRFVVADSSADQNFAELEAAGYDMENEAACRIRAEYLMVPAIAQARREVSGANKLRTDGRPNPPTMPKQNFTEHRPELLVIYPEMNLKAELKHPNSGQRYVVTGRADWAAGYGKRAATNQGSVLFCVEAKQSTTFFKASTQLITYLAMCWYARREKVNPGVRGFSTDGIYYEFVDINNNGEIYRSKILDTRDQGEAKTVYNWIISQLKVAIHSSPTTTPIISQTFG
jgi:hypothetical protein